MRIGRRITPSATASDTAIGMLAAEVLRISCADIGDQL
jgi:hypothetical protein